MGLLNRAAEIQPAGATERAARSSLLEKAQQFLGKPNEGDFSRSHSGLLEKATNFYKQFLQPKKSEADSDFFQEKELRGEALASLDWERPEVSESLSSEPESKLELIDAGEGLSEIEFSPEPDIDELELEQADLHSYFEDKQEEESSDEEQDWELDLSSLDEPDLSASGEDLDLEVEELPQTTESDQEIKLGESETENFSDSTDWELEDFLEDASAEDLPDPEQSMSEDPFESWVEEAEALAKSEPISPEKEPKKDFEKEEFLFDDDSDFSTAPIDYQIASRKKLENYLSVFEISKEIARSYSFSDFFENLVFSIIGQMGADTIAVFSSESGNYSQLELVASEGFEHSDEWKVHENDELYEKAANAFTTIYVKQIFRDLRESERKIMEATRAELLVPIRDGNQFYGFYLLGKTIQGEDYSAEDLEFLKVVGEIAASVIDRILNMETMQNREKALEDSLHYNEAILHLSRELSSVRNLDEGYDRLLQILREDLKVSRVSLFLLDDENHGDYRVFASNVLSPATMESFSLKQDSEIIGIVFNVTGVYRLEEFSKHPELSAGIPNDELALMDEWVMVPLINLGWLVGLLVIHQIDGPWTDSIRNTMVGISEASAPIFSNLLILKEKEALFSNPFRPLERKLDEFIHKTESLDTVFTAVVFKIPHVNRILNLKGSAFFARYSDTVRKCIQMQLTNSDYLYRSGQGKFLALLDGKDREESDIVVRKIKDQLDTDLEPIKGFPLTVSTHLLTFPAETKDRQRIFELVEET